MSMLRLAAVQGFIQPAQPVDVPAIARLSVIAPTAGTMRSAFSAASRSRLAIQSAITAFGVAGVRR